MSETVNCQLSTVRCRKTLHGFSLIEMLLSLFLLSSFVVILLTSTLVLKTRFATDKHVVANRLASKEIERLRNQAWAKIVDPAQRGLPDNNEAQQQTNLGPGAAISDNFYNATDSCIANPLGAGCGCTSTTCTSNIVGVEITVTWSIRGASYFTVYKTLISQNGLHGT